jgi:hypothetical protein
VLRRGYDAPDQASIGEGLGLQLLDSLAANEHLAPLVETDYSGPTPTATKHKSPGTP